MDQLYKLARDLGVRVQERDPGRGRAGVYVHYRSLILIRPGLRARQARHTLAHEIGHAVRGDIPTGDPRYDARAELAADQFAARLLINRADVRRAESIYGDDRQVAIDLDVTPELLAVWRGMNQRIGAG